MIVSFLQRRFSRGINDVLTRRHFNFNFFARESCCLINLKSLFCIRLRRVKRGNLFQLISPVKQKIYTWAQDLLFKGLASPIKFGSFLLQDLVANFLFCIDFIVLKNTFYRFLTFPEKQTDAMLSVFLAWGFPKIKFVLVRVNHQLKFLFCVFYPFSHHHQTIVQDHLTKGIFQLAAVSYAKELFGARESI